MNTPYTLARSRIVEIGELALEGDLTIPDSPRGIIAFAHGSGSSRFSSRNRWVASQLNQHQLATLLFDLLTPEEALIDERTREFRFDIQLLGDRMIQTVDWITQQEELRDLPVGLFGASTGAAAALIAAAARPGIVRAVVSRGGRPDLAGPALPRVQAPTLLIVGGNDHPVIALNKEAQLQMTAETQLEIVPGASHLFEEPGTLDTVAQLAQKWFCDKLARG